MPPATPSLPMSRPQCLSSLSTDLAALGGDGDGDGHGDGDTAMEAGVAWQMGRLMVVLSRVWVLGFRPDAVTRVQQTLSCRSTL